MECAWKENWEETKRHFCDWWRGEGLVVGAWGPPGGREPREETPDPGPSQGLQWQYEHPEWRAQSQHRAMARSRFPIDVLPMPNLDLGPGSLALYMGSEPGFAPGTVWYNSTIEDVEKPEDLPPLQFDPDNRWWRLTVETLQAAAELADGKYLLGCPDLIENIDTLASLRGTQRLLFDMTERPEWVEECMWQINQAFFEAYERIYDIIKMEDGGSAFRAFAIWGPGKTAKVQCDASAMFSPAMFERFVVPALTEQCEWLDYSMFHLDGHQCIPHLDLLLEIEALDAVEWTPDPQVPPPADPEWYPMYRRILEAGKSVQVLQTGHDQLAPLLDAIGPKGVYVMTEFESEADAEKVARIVEPYR
ncbi:MAG: hypothetical protein R6V05_01045 [Candidatus Brocadiia bacterium]